MIQKAKALILTLLLALSAAPAFAQNAGTPMPTPRMQFFDNNGDPLAGCKLYTYTAGTLTALATYADATLATPNANPVVCDSAGRLTVFLGPSVYKFILKTSADVTIWTVDGVNASAPFNVDVDVQITAGENLSMNDAIYMSATDGKWYRTDSDAVGTSIAAPVIALSKAAITINETGSARMAGRMTGLSGLVTGNKYYLSGTAGGMTSTAPTNRRLMGIADSATTLVLAVDQFDAGAATLYALTTISDFNATGIANITGPLTVTGQSALGVTTLGSAVFGTGTISPPQITSSQNNYAPTGFVSAYLIRLSADVGLNITGLAGGAAGRIVVLCNVGTNNISLPTASASSSAENQFAVMPILTVGMCNQIIYDGVSQKWRHMGGPG